MNNEGSQRRRGFYDQLRKSPITRQDSQWLGGVATGVADYFKVDVVLIRGIFVVLGVLGGLGMVLYGLAWALLPDTGGKMHLESAVNRNWTSGMTGAVIIFALGIFPAPWFLDSLAPVLWPLAIVAAIAFIIFSRKNTRFARPDQARNPAATGDSSAASPRAAEKSTALEHPWREDGTQSFNASVASGFGTNYPDAPMKEHPMNSGDSGPAGQYENSYSPDPAYTKAYSAKANRKPISRPIPGWLGTTVFGVTVLVVAVVMLADYLDIVALPGSGWTVALACGLLLVGITIVLAALSGRTSGGLLGLAIPLLVLTVIFSATSFEESARGFVRSATGSDSQYSAVFSSSTVDLTHLGSITKPTTVEIDSVFSRMDLLLPENVPVKIETDGAFLSGMDMELPQDRRSLPGNAPMLTIEVDGVFSSFSTTVDDPSILNPSNTDF
ncbi:MAG: PspC domain-containing protein [Glutamicibacter sp.]|uniref:PspC domain-containing protein n=2 Tax=Glutamicibacter sp. TaxID=1931995 RepID=UPI002FC9C804